MAIEPFLGTRSQKIFLSTIVVQAIVVLALVAAVLALVDNRVDTSELAYKTLPCYFALFALAEIFEVAVSVDALRLRNIIQLVGILIFHAAMLVMACIQIQQTEIALVRNPGGSCDGDGYATCGGPNSLFAVVQKILIVVPVILGVTLLALIWVTRDLFAEFGWAVFHAIGADPSMKNMYQMYQIMICLLKFDFFAFVGLTMQLIIIVLSKDKAEFGLTIAAIPIVFVLLIFCGIAVAREIKWLMTFSLVLMLGAQAYFIYKLYRFYTPPTADDYSTTRGSLTTFCVFSLILLFATFAVGVRCFLDFDKGLRQSKTFGNRNGSTFKNGSSDGGRPGMVQQGSSYFAGGAPLQQRISIE